MSDFDVKEKRFEEDIEDYLIHHGGYTKGNPKKFKAQSQNLWDLGFLT